jgi:hypothetical protein
MLEDLALPIYREESAKDKEIEDKIMKDLEQPSNQN